MTEFSQYKLRFLLYLANTFIVGSFIILLVIKYTTNLNSNEYYLTTRLLISSLLVFVSFLIFLGLIILRKSEIPTTVYKIYIGFLLIAIINSVILLITSIDETQSIKNEIKNDISKFNNRPENGAPSRLDYIQTSFRCCGLKSSEDYNGEKPESCEIIKNSKKIIAPESTNLLNLNKSHLRKINTPKIKEDKNEIDTSIYERDIESDKNVKIDKGYENYNEKNMNEDDLGQENLDDKKKDEDKNDNYLSFYYNEKEYVLTGKYFGKGCWKKIKDDYSKIKDSTNSTGIVIICSSISAAILTCMLFIVRK